MTDVTEIAFVLWLVLCFVLGWVYGIDWVRRIRRRFKGGEK